MTTKYILAISGNDIFSGGGLYADLATYTVNNLHGFVAVTCLTALTDKGFEVFATDSTVFSHQLNSLRDVPFSGIKLGLLPNGDIARQALEFVKAHADIPVVLDPVLVCKESHDTEVSVLRKELLKFFPYVKIITPNLTEAELLIGKKIGNLEEMKEAAQALCDLGAKTVVIKGGNRLSKDRAIDVFYDGQDFQILDYPILEHNNIGAGCTFASSIASQLVLGKTANEAVREAKAFVYHAIEQSNDYGVKQNYDRS